MCYGDEERIELSNAPDFKSMRTMYDYHFRRFYPFKRYLFHVAFIRSASLLS